MSTAPLRHDDALARDRVDPLASFRDRFPQPPRVRYFDGNSLGVPARGVAERRLEQRHRLVVRVEQVDDGSAHAGRPALEQFAGARAEPLAGHLEIAQRLGAPGRGQQQHHRIAPQRGLGTAERRRGEHARKHVAEPLDFDTAELSLAENWGFNLTTASRGYFAGYPDRHWVLDKHWDSVDVVLRAEMAKIGARPPLSSFGIWMLGPALLKYGNEEQKKEFLTPFARGEKLGCFGLTEPEAGSDAAAQKTTAVKKGNEYVINGSKNWITVGPKADAIVLFAMTDKAAGHKGISAFLVPTNTPGFQRAPPDKKMGINAAWSCSMFFEDCRVPAKNLLGKEGENGFGSRALQVLGDDLGLGRLPRVHALDDHQSSLAAEQTERVARGHGVVRTMLGRPQHLDRTVVEAVAQAFDDDANLRAIASRDQVDRLEVRHRRQA